MILSGLCSFDTSLPLGLRVKERRRYPDLTKERVAKVCGGLDDSTLVGSCCTETSDFDSIRNSKAERWTTYRRYFFRKCIEFFYPTGPSYT